MLSLRLLSIVKSIGRIIILAITTTVTHTIVNINIFSSLYTPKLITSLEN